MKVFVTRHGQTSWNALGKIQGKTDIELNETGKNQARETGEAIKNEHIDIIISSPLKRAKETAQIINKNFNVEIIDDERLMERGFGKSEGLTKDEILALKEKHGQIYDVWNYNANTGFNDIEKMQDFCARIYDFLDDVTEIYKEIGRAAGRERV